MGFLELAKKRYSVRAYKADSIEDEKLQQKLASFKKKLAASIKRSK